MDKYDELAARHGVEVAPFTEGYLQLYNDGMGLLERFIKENPGVRLVSTTELEKWIKKDRQVTFDER
jgi:hypothetical protein